MIPLAAVLSDNLTAIILGLLTAGALTFVRDAVKFIRARAARNTPEAQENERRRLEQARVNDAVEAANNSVVVAVRSNAMLQADAERYQREIAAINTRHDQERAAWHAERDAMQASHDRDRERWESQRSVLQAELDAMERRWREALDDLVDFRQRIDQATPGQST